MKGNRMNLCDLIRRKDSNLELPNKHSIARLGVNGIKLTGFWVDTWKGRNNPLVIFKLKKPFQWYPFRELHSYSEWGVQWDFSSSREAELQVLLTTKGHQRVVKTIPIKPKTFIKPFQQIPQDLDAEEMTVTFRSQRTSLPSRILQFVGLQKSRLFITNHEVMDRKVLLKYCVGKGIELGPGHNPFLKPEDGFDVSYLEQHHPEKWADLYGSAKFVVDPKKWSRYIIGEAHQLPVEDGSLDYIFSSHVFEHLYNPLGHIEHWLHKLKSGGHVVAVIPAIEGCKDYMAQATGLDELIKEYKEGGFAPRLEQYEYYAHLRSMNQTGEQLMEKKRSIHVHFYTGENMKIFLNWISANLPIASCDLIYKMNNKDFYLVIRKK
ncbi:MAG: methyltransferase domain-containing protein [Bdellovibrionaceae bacterium]|nr:methyltransferase domain-containing protein [Pseudobdellovibrionaceae bacterium]